MFVYDKVQSTFGALGLTVNGTKYFCQGRLGNRAGDTLVYRHKITS